LSAASRFAVVLIVAIMVAAAASVDADPCCITLVPPPPPPPPPPPTEAVNVSYGAVYAQIGIVIARDRALFGDLRVELRQSDILSAISEVSKTTGYVGIGPINSVVQYAGRQDGRVHVIATLVAKPDYALFAPRTAPEDIAWLKGRKIGIPSTGSLAHLYAIRALDSKGLNWRDVTFVAVDPKVWASPPMVGATMFQGTFAATPLFAGLSVTGATGQIKAVVGPGAVTMPTWVLYVGSGTLEREADQLGRFVQGIEAGLRVAKSEPAQVRKALDMLGVRGPIVAAVSQLAPTVLPDSVRPNIADVQQTVRLLTEIGNIAEPPPLADETTIGMIFNRPR